MAAPKGHPRYGGRPKGVLNQYTADVKTMILDALNAVGGADYLAMRAHDHPGAFLALVGRVLPLQVTGANGGPLLVGWDMATQPLTIEETAHEQPSDSNEFLDAFGATAQGSPEAPPAPTAPDQGTDGSSG